MSSETAVSFTGGHFIQAVFAVHSYPSLLLQKRLAHLCDVTHFICYASVWEYCGHPFSLDHIFVYVGAPTPKLTLKILSASISRLVTLTMVTHY